MTEVNSQIDIYGQFCLKSMLVDTTLIKAASHLAPEGQSSNDPDACWGGKADKLIHSFNGTIGVDQKIELMRQTDLTPASKHVRQRFRAMISGDETVAQDAELTRAKSAQTGC